MRLFQFMIISVVLILSVAACSDKATSKDEVPAPEDNNGENNKENELKDDIIIETKDGKVTFELLSMRDDISEQEIEKLKRRILDAYTVVKESISTSYTPQDEINIFLYNGTKASSGYASNITLYAKDINNYPIVHEMTHTILGYGKGFDGSRGFFTQEGFATYMEGKFGFSKTMFLGYSTDSIMKFLISKDKIFPLSQLMDLDSDDAYFRPVINKPSDGLLRTLSYAYAGSFIGYLIDKYGMEKFERVYNQPNLHKVLQQVYGKSVPELETEWLAHIKKAEENIIAMQQKKNMDNINNMLNSINPELFK